MILVFRSMFPADTLYFLCKVLAPTFKRWYPILESKDYALNQSSQDCIIFHMHGSLSRGVFLEFNNE